MFAIRLVYRSGFVATTYYADALPRIGDSLVVTAQMAGDTTAKDHRFRVEDVRHHFGSDGFHRHAVLVDLDPKLDAWPTT